MRHSFFLFALVLGFVETPTAAQPTIGGKDFDEPRLYITEVGSGDQVIIVLHGGPGLSHDYLRPEWDRLAEHQRRVVYYDQRGCGRSDDGPPYTWRADISDLDRVIEYVSPTTPVILAGSSWGSWLALLYAMEHPERITALVLSGTPPWWHKPLSSYSEMLLRNIRESQGMRIKSEVDIRARTGRADSVNQGLLQIQRVRLDTAGARVHLPPGDSLLAFRLARPPQLSCPDAHAARVPHWYDIAPIDSLSRVDLPTLLVWGRGDRMLGGNEKSLANHLRQASVHIIEDVGHDPWFDRPGTFFMVVDSFLTRRVQRP